MLYGYGLIALVMVLFGGVFILARTSIAVFASLLASVIAAGFIQYFTLQDNVNYQGEVYSPSVFILELIATCIGIGLGCSLALLWSYYRRTQTKS